MKPKYTLEPFNDSELMVNITNHFVSILENFKFFKKQNLLYLNVLACTTACLVKHG